MNKEEVEVSHLLEDRLEHQLGGSATGLTVLKARILIMEDLTREVEEVLPVEMIMVVVDVV